MHAQSEEKVELQAYSGHQQKCEMLWQPETLLEVRGLMSFPSVLASRYISAVAAAPGNSSNLLASACRLGAAESDVDLSADELEERMEAFMRKQAEQESGEPSVVPSESIAEDMSRRWLCCAQHLPPSFRPVCMLHPEQGLCAQ